MFSTLLGLHDNLKNVSEDALNIALIGVAIVSLAVMYKGSTTLKAVFIAWVVFP